jgi:hypothetical protein
MECMNKLIIEDKVSMVVHFLNELFGNSIKDIKLIYAKDAPKILICDYNQNLFNYKTFGESIVNV